MTAIDWPAFLLVIVSAFVGAVAMVSLFAVGVRLLATPAPGALAAAEPDPDDRNEDDPTTPSDARPRIATAGALLAFVLAAGVAALGVVLIVT